MIKKKTDGHPLHKLTTTRRVSESYKNQYINYLLIYVSNVNTQIKLKIDDTIIETTPYELNDRGFIIGNFPYRIPLLPILTHYDTAEAIMVLHVGSFVNDLQITLVPPAATQINYSIYVVYTRGTSSREEV